MYRTTFTVRPPVFLMVIAIIVAGIVLPGSAQPVVRAQAQPIPIGIAVAQTSNVALLGQEQVIGAQIAEDYFNKAGGVNGTPIKLVYQDTAGDEAGAINAFQTLISNGNVVAIIGPTLSQQAFAADPIANKAGVPVIAPSNTAAGIPAIGEFVTRVSAPVAAYAPDAIQAALNINKDIKNVAVFFAQNDAFSKSETQTFQAAVKDKFKLNLLPVQTFQTTDTDFTTQATNALAGNPDLIIISGLAADGGNLVRQLRDLGFKGLMIGGNGLNTANIFPVCKASCDGLLIAQAYSPSLDDPVNNAFRTAYKAKQGKEPPQFSAQLFAGVKVVVDALTTLDKSSKISGMALPDLRKALMQAILSGTFDTPLGEISFDSQRELFQKSFYVAQIKMNADASDGAFNLVGTFTVEKPAATMAATAASK